MLERKFSFRSKTAENRLIFQPMEGCDCLYDGSPSEITARKYARLAAGGAGILWLEASAVCSEGRTNLRQMLISEKNVGAFAKLADTIREKALAATGVVPLLFLQLTHSGRQSLQPLILYDNPVYRKAGVQYTVADDGYLDRLPDRFAAAAKLAVRAGFDGIDVKACHGYLLAESLSAFNRAGRYGGSFENRSRLFLRCAEAVAAATGGGTVLASRLGITDMVRKPWGFGTDEDGNADLTEPLILVGKLHAIGAEIVNVTVGNPYYNPHVNRPFRKGPYAAPETPQEGLARFYTLTKAVKAAHPQTAVVMSGLSYYAERALDMAERFLQEGVCDFAGLGRGSIAYPRVYLDWKNGAADKRNMCVLCSKCTEMMRRGEVSGCAVQDPFYREIYKGMNVCAK